MYKLKHTLIFFFVILSLTLTISIGIFSNKIIKNNFNQYIKSSIEEKKERIFNDISNSITENTSLNTTLIENIGVNALKDGLIIRVQDLNKQDIWNARTHNNGLCEEILRKMSLSMHQLNPHVKGDYVTHTYDISHENNKVAILSISYYGPYFYTDIEVIFFKTLYNLLFLISIIYILFSILIGFIVSSFIDKPLTKVVSSSKLIAEGNYTFVLKEKSKIKEINQLIFSINKLSKNLAIQEDLRKVLTKDISHELRTPLAIIQGFLEALIDGIWEPTSERLESMYKEIQRLTRLTNSLENILKYENKTTILHLEKTDIRQLISKIIVIFEKEIYDKNISCHLDLTDISLYVDKDQISQALFNIISNSIKYSKMNGKIFIQSFVKKENIIITIKDTGIGIDQKNLPFIFERFYRSDESRSRMTGGSGIGLTISQAIIHAHNGEIIVKSEMNEGTEVFIILKINTNT